LPAQNMDYLSGPSMETFTHSSSQSALQNIPQKQNTKITDKHVELPTGGVKIEIIT
jgi:hypothetical protein